jgi:hypothetical protein
MQRGVSDTLVRIGEVMHSRRAAVAVKALFAVSGPEIPSSPGPPW